jgi:two-component sensor histidine kinase
MAAGAEQALLDFCQEPMFLLTPQGTILRANAAAARVIGRNPTGEDVAACVGTPAADLRAWLNRCSGTTSPLVGQLLLRRPDGGAARFRAHGARLRDGGQQVRIAVRCAVPDGDRFSLLKKEVEQLNAEAHERRRKQALLEEALRQNEVMLREINHRVKNNIQMMVGLFSAAIRETASEEVKAVLQAANQRLLAVGAAQDMMYETQQLTTVPAAAFIAALARTSSASLGRAVDVDASAADGRLSNEVAFPLALILNELVTNAVKHGDPGGSGAVRVALERRGDEFRLIVRDCGPGVASVPPERQRRSSGLGLVRGLCRQIGAELSITNDGGARIVVRFTAPQQEENA